MPEGPTALHPADATYLAFDFGMRRIGVAAGAALTGSARPLPLLPARDGVPDWGQLSALLAEWQPDALVVGIPVNADGTAHEVTHAARRFMNRLHGRYRLPVHPVDERLSSVEAAARLRTTGGRRPALDSVAAQVILETWFAQQRNPNS